jgi:hypothetical protein
MRKLTVITALLAIGVALPAVAPAKDNPGVMRTGVCSGLGASWKLKAKHDDGRVETEFEVDQNRNGRRWNVVIRRNANAAGRDRIVSTARSVGGGGVCRGVVTV